MKKEKENLKSVDVPGFVSKLIQEYRNENMLIESGHVECDFFDSGNLALNYILSGRFDVGYPVGQVIGISGDPATGKSLMIGNAISNFLQKYKDGVAILDDTEYAYVDYLGSKMGIDESRFIRLSTSSVEEHSKAVFFGGKVVTGEGEATIDIAEPIIPKLYNNGVKHILVAVDSIAAWSTEHEMKIGLEKPDMSKAKVLRALLRTIMPEIKKYGITYMITNHLIFNIGDMFGPKKVETGGTSPAYQSSVRLMLSIDGKIKDKNSNEILGIVTKAQTVKNRFAPPFRKCGLEIYFDSGLSKYSGLIDLLIGLGVVKLGNGGWYEVVGTNDKFQSKDIANRWDKIRELIKKHNVLIRGEKNNSGEGDKQDVQK